MSRDSSGTYVLPAGNPVTPDTIIESAWANTTMPDLGNEITNSLDRQGRGGMLAPLKVFDGTPAAPGVGFTLDPNNGLARIGTDNWVLVAGGGIEIDIKVGQVNIPNLVSSGLAAQYLPLTGGSLTGNLNFNGTGLRITGDFSSGSGTLKNRLMFMTNVVNSATNVGIIPNGTQVNARLQIFGANDPDNCNYLNIAQQNNASVIRSQVSGSVAAGPLSLGIGTTDKLIFAADGLSATFTVPTYTPALGLTAVVASISGATTLDWLAGSSRIHAVSASASVTVTNIPVGNIMRIVFKTTNNGLTINGVLWPLGVTPDFTSGPNKIALVVIENANGSFLGNASMY